MVTISELTQTEDDILIGSQGDYFQVVSGVIEFTRFEEIQPVKWATVMFASDDPSWGTREWEFPIGDRVPNGRGLMIFYRRGDVAFPFGLVALPSRAWTHAWPLIDQPFYRRSTLNRKFRVKVFLARLLAPFVLLAFFGLPSMLGPGSTSSGSPGTGLQIAIYAIIALLCCFGFLMRRVQPDLGLRMILLVLGIHDRRYIETLERTARGLVWRVARDAERYCRSVFAQGREKI